MFLEELSPVSAARYRTKADSAEELQVVWRSAFGAGRYRSLDRRFLILLFESSRELVVRQSPDIQSYNLRVPASNLMLSHPQSSVGGPNSSGSARPSQNPGRQRVWGRSSHLACHTRERRWVQSSAIDRLRRAWAMERPTNDKRETNCRHDGGSHIEQQSRVLAQESVTKGGRRQEKVAPHEESWPALMHTDQTETKTRMDHRSSSQGYKQDLLAHEVRQDGRHGKLGDRV